MLSHFIYNGLSMTKIESRPITGKKWEYRFFVDFEGNLEEPAVKNALRGLGSGSQSDESAWQLWTAGGTVR